MKDKIFKSCFNLQFTKKETEAEYENHKCGLIKKYILLYSFLMLLFAFGTSITASIYLEKFYLRVDFRITTYTSYFISIIYIVFLIISAFVKNPQVLKYMNYVNYYLITFIFVNFRYGLVNWIKVDIIIFYAINTFEIVVRVSWLLIGLLGFLESVLLNTLIILSNWIYYVPIQRDEFTFYFLIAHTIVYVIVISFSYSCEYQQRKSFYFILVANKKNKWFSNIFENMNTGFISVKDGKIKYINKFMLENLIKIKSIKQNILNHFSAELNFQSDKIKIEEKLDFFKKNSDFILEEILTNLNLDLLFNTAINLLPVQLNTFTTDNEDMYINENNNVTLNINKNKQCSNNLNKENIEPQAITFFSSFIKKFLRFTKNQTNSNFLLIGTRTFNLEECDKEIGKI